MKKALSLIFGLIFVFICAAECLAADKRIVLLISEQNISGPQAAWWASEVDLSAVESVLADKLAQAGYEIVDPSDAHGVIKSDAAFRLVNIPSQKAILLGRRLNADYCVVGKALASAGGNVPQSQMKSCFANINARLISVKSGKVVASLAARGNSAHLDPITGGGEALGRAAEDLASKLIAALAKLGGTK